ncbi:MAG TPA: acyl-CoA dehydrogenase family protein [Sporichthya sp.]|nr:acyl-CoA dehydrogenase family protein [Sporichthya sp.]
MTIRQRAVYDPDHEAFRDSVSRLLATEPTDFFGAASEYGFVGLGAADVEDPRFAAVVLEATMAAGRPEIALALAMHDGFALPLLGGRGVPALAAVVDPPDAGVRAAPTGDGWVLEGAAECVVNGLGADLLLVVARSDDDSELLLTIDPAAPGLRRVPADDLLGLDGCDVAELRFDAVAVPAAARLDSPVDRGRARYQLALAVAAVAGARTALATTVAYVRERKAFGTPIASFGNTRHVLGALGARIAAVESFVDAGLARATEIGGAEAAAIKLCATDVLGEAVDTGVQLHGGYGYMWEYPIARAYAAARFFRLHGGAGEHLDVVLASAVGL